MGSHGSGVFMEVWAEAASGHAALTAFQVNRYCAVSSSAVIECGVSPNATQGATVGHEHLADAWANGQRSRSPGRDAAVMLTRERAATTGTSSAKSLRTGLSRAPNSERAPRRETNPAMPHAQIRAGFAHAPLRGGGGGGPGQMGFSALSRLFYVGRAPR